MTEEPKRYYLATALEAFQRAHVAHEVARAAGWACTFNWAAELDPSTPPRLRDLAHKYVSAIRTADVVIVMLPGGRGTHAELGMAIAFRKPVILIATDDQLLAGADERTCAFYSHLHVERVDSIGALPDALARAGHPSKLWQ